MTQAAVNQQYVPALALDDFPQSGIASVVLGGWHVLIAKVGDDFFALNDRCSHAASPLSTGRLRHGAIMCPLHGARFELASGKCIGGANRAVPSFRVRIASGMVEVAVPSEPPGLADLPVITA